MDGLRFSGILVCLVLGGGAIQQATAGDTVAIAEFLNESKGSEAESEWVELYNYGDSAVRLAGWTLVDDDTDLATLPDFTLAPGAYAIVARDKAVFEIEWLAGVPDSRVVGFEGTFALSSTADELVLKNASGTQVWRIAYVDDDTVGRASWLTGTSFSRTSWGTKAAPAVHRRGPDTGGELGYESDDATVDPFRFSAGNRDWGSPLRGAYGGAATPVPPRVIAADAPGTTIHPGVRGVALSDMTLERPATWRGIPDSLAVGRGSAIRGVAGGLYADLYDWRTRVSSYHSGYGDDTQPRPPTLQFLRWARDFDASLFITVNTRGLVKYDPVNAGKVRYYTSDTLTLARLDADWVRYVNRIVPAYRQGDAVADSRDSDLLASLVWHSSFTGDAYDTLLAPGERPVPPVVYWEIGNEPTVSVAGGIGVSNGYTLGPEDYAARYKAIVAAMKAEDAYIKVGPCLVNGSGSNAGYIAALASDSSIPIDFISYHPYQKLGDETTVDGMEEVLGTVYSNQYGRCKDIRDALAAAGRDPALVDLVASEVNVSNWSYNETMKEGEMAHALGSVETVFSYARLGLTAAHYWIWPADADDGTPYPVFKAFEKLRDRMGDCLIDFMTIGNQARVYVTRDSATGRVAVWGLNFQNGRTETARLSFTGFSTTPTVRLCVLKNPNGATTLTSGNYSANRPGGPRNEVDWVETPLDGADPANLEITLEPATLTVVTLQAEIPTGTPCDGWTLH